MCEYCTPAETTSIQLLLDCDNRTTLTTNSNSFSSTDYIYKSCDRVKLKLAGLLQQPSISELNERLDKILTWKKNETNLNQTLKENIRECLVDYYKKLTDEKLSLNRNLNENRNILNDLVDSLAKNGVKIRSNAFIIQWYENLTKFEADLNCKQLHQINKLENVLSEKTSELEKLTEDFDKKQKEIDALKRNFDELNENISLLNDSLFDIKHINLNLKDDINNLRQQIEFYKSTFGESNISNKKSFLDNSLNLSLDSNIGSIFSSISSMDTSSSPEQTTSSTTSSGICLRQTHPQMSTSTSTSSLTSISLPFYETQIDEFTSNSHEDYYKNELNVIRNDIRAEFEIYMNAELEIFEDECEADFYVKLDAEEIENERLNKKEDEEYDELSNDISRLNDEYLQNLSEFIQLNDSNTNLSERLISLSESIVKFSRSSSNQCEFVMIKYSLNTLKRHIEETKMDVEKIENRLKQMKNLLFNKNIDYILSENLLLKSIKTIVPISQLRSMLNFNSNLLAQQLFEVSYTQTNIFGYVQFSFSLNHKTSSINIIQNKIDTSALTIENLDKVLDLDLSEWILRREIYGSLKSSKELEQFEFKFPKGFKLKRRKKLVLLSTSAKLSDYEASSVEILKSKKPLSNKVDSRGIFQSKVKDVDLYICSNIQNWGCGLQTATKLINNKNMTKYVNYRSFKSIWSNL